ncbi:hypothetical protein [Synechococcus sp. 1G10]|uniref:hypothetical protein n=1 Tax=Synechococcus sp. 1G10 TaxID=2025605 RepID=UPI00351470EC
MSEPHGECGGLHHLDQCVVQKAVKQGQDIRTIQEQMGQQDVSTTMIYTHVLKSGPIGVNSSADLVKLFKKVIHEPINHT